MDSAICVILAAVFCAIKTAAEPPPLQGIRPSNILGGAGQHASFSFVRPGLTQTSYSFNGPSSHQAFSSSIGDSHLAQKVLPNVAQALAYRNPGLGYFPTGPIANGYAASNQQYQNLAAGNPAPVPTGQVVYQGTPVRPSEGQIDQATALAYLQQQFQQQYRQQYLQAQQQYQAQHLQDQGQQDSAAYQAQLHALRQAQAQGQSSEESQQIQLQQQEQQQQSQAQNLLGVAYSSAPSVAHVKVTGNGYNFDF